MKKLDAPQSLPLHRFPVEPWRLVEREFCADDTGVTETLFAVANGYLGMRANAEEGRIAHSHGTFLNGFHETWSIHHAEEAFGFAKTGQTIVNVPGREADEAVRRRRAAPPVDRRPRVLRTDSRLPHGTLSR
jgi:alpha,alpha-trehalose phosphorylase